MTTDPGIRRAASAPAAFGEDQVARRTLEFIRTSDDIVEVRKVLEDRFPDLARAELDLFIAALVIENNLGEDWVERNIDGLTLRKGSSNYLRAQPIDLQHRHEHYMRVVELARRIFELGQETFAPRLLDNLRHRDLEGAAFEADVVRMLMALPLVIEMREEMGAKGDDYDIDVWIQRDVRWPIEVKTRADNAPYSDKALTRTLERARTQLPEEGIGTIFLKVPTPWLGSGSYRRNHADAVAHFLRGTGRVHAVVLVWDVWTQKTFGKGLTWRRGVRVFKAAHAHSWVAYTLDTLEKLWHGGWDIGPTAPF